MPGVVEWVVGFPRAQGKGGVSVQVWGWVCVVVLGVVGEGFVWVGGGEWVRLKGEKKGMGEGMKMAGVGGGGGRQGEKEGKKSQ